MRVIGAADAAEGAVTLFFIEEALGIHGWTGALLLAHLLIRRLAWGADYMLLRAMVSDLVRSGSNGFAATHYALFNVANKLAAALGVLGALTALAFIGFLPGAVHGPGETALRAIYALPSCLAGLIGLLALRRVAPAQCRSVS